MPRLFLVEKIADPSLPVHISGEELKHLRVMRLKPGDLINITDGSGGRYKAQIAEVTRTRGVINILRSDFSRVALKPKITLGQAIPRFSKMEMILQKTTELGVNCICPLRTERSFLPQGKGLSANRWERWVRITSQAAKQSGRTSLPRLVMPQTLDSFLQNESDAGLKLCIWEGVEQDKGLKDILKRLEKADSISLLIGPEGSFSPDEIERIKCFGYHTLLCGPRIMRVETAALIIVAICQYEWGDF